MSGVRSMDIPIQQEWVADYQKQLADGKLKPLLVQWFATHKCNFRCPFCGTAAGEAKPDEFTTEEILPVIDGLGEIGTNTLSVSGGEPILREDLWEIFARAKQAGIPHYGFVTNGWAVRDYAEQIRESGVSTVVVSIDGYRENHDKMRQKEGAYERCMKALEFFAELDIEAITVSMVVMEENVDEIQLIAEDAFKHGAKHMRLQTTVPEGRSVGRTINREMIKQLFRYGAELRGMGMNIDVGEGFGYLGPLAPFVRSYHFLCGCGWNTFTINHDGTVQGCPVIEYPEINEGNVKDTPITEIWEKRFERFRGKHHAELPEECDGCEVIDACRGGCFMMRAYGTHCWYKEALEVFEEIKDHVKSGSTDRLTKPFVP